MIEKSLGHLAAAGVMHADKQHRFHINGLPFMAWTVIFSFTLFSSLVVPVEYG
jgi:hypothetical protein